MSLLVAPARGRVVAVTAIAGSAGRSVLAANLAFELSAMGSRVCLLDLDDEWPSLHRYFGLPQNQAAVLAAMRLLEQGKLDASALEQINVRLVAKAVSIDFLSGYGLNLNRQAMNLDSLEQLIRYLSGRYDFVIADTSLGNKSQLLETVGALADARLLTCQADPVNIGRLLEAYPALTGAEQAFLVVNRLRASVLGAKPELQVQQLLKERTHFTSAAIIPEDAAFDEAMLRGLPLRQVAPKSKALLAIAEIASRLQEGRG